MQLLSTVDEIFETRGSAYYGAEPVSQLQHALQAARLAEAEGAPPALVVAALLHDVGHLLGSGGERLVEAGIDGRHEISGARFLGQWFGPSVTEPVRLHVQAKAYLCHVDADYYNGLSQGSRDSLAVQGGPLDAPRADHFRRQEYWQDAVRLRQWDDRAKDPGVETPGLPYYLGIASWVASAD